MPGCCGVQLHQPCLDQCIKSSKSAKPSCPSCKKALPSTMIPSAVSNSSASYVTVPMTSKFPDSFHIDKLWAGFANPANNGNDTNPNLNRLGWKNQGTTPFAACCNIRAQLSHHGYTGRNIGLVHIGLTSLSFVSLVYPNGVSTETIKEEIFKKGPVVSLSFKPNSINKVEQNDLPIIVGRTKLPLLGEVWIVRQVATGNKESHIPIGTLNIELDIGVPTLDVNNSRWQPGPFVQANELTMGLIKDRSNFCKTLSYLEFAEFLNGFSDGPKSRTELLRSRPPFEVYAGSNMANSRKAHLSDIELDKTDVKNLKMKIIGKFDPW